MQDARSQTSITEAKSETAETAQNHDTAQNESDQFLSIEIRHIILIKTPL